MVRTGNVMTVLLAGLDFIYAASVTEAEFIERETPTKGPWLEGGIRLKPEFVTLLGEEAAKKINGQLMKTWFDRGAGGYFADIEVEAGELHG